MPAPKKEPEWVAPFLAALGSCGNVTRAASLAGIDTTGPYNRRNRYPAFKAAWERVLAEREMRAGGPSTGLGTSGEVEGGETPLTLPLRGSLPLPQAGEGLVIGPAGDGVKLSRVAASRGARAQSRRLA